MTQELERALRATFEDRADPVPAQEADIADRVLTRAGRIRRRRVAVAGAATAVVALVMSVAAVTGALPGLGPSGPDDVTAGPQPSATITASGIDAVVNTSSDGKGPYIRTSDGATFEVDPGWFAYETARVPGGFLTLTQDVTGSSKDSRLTFFDERGTPKRLTIGPDLDMRVSADGTRVAVLDNTRPKDAPTNQTGSTQPTLRVYSLPDGGVTAERPLTENTLLEGWAGGNVLFSSDHWLQSWNPSTGTARETQPDVRLQLLGTTPDGNRVPMAKYMNSNGCTVAVDVEANFTQTTGPNCYAKAEFQRGQTSLSPNGRWLAARVVNVGENSSYTCVIDLDGDFSPTADRGHMDPLPNEVYIGKGVWTSDNRLLIRSGEDWAAYDPGSKEMTPVDVQDGYLAEPIPRYGS